MELHADDPFDLIGIATDSDPEMYAKRAADADVTWRNAWNPGPGRGLPSVFGVQAFPTVILLDAEGRALWEGHFFEGDPRFEEALTRALEEARAGAGD